MGGKELEDKHAATFATADRFLHLVARGTQEDLELHVSNAIEFIENKARTTIVVMDQTAVWLKLRGEDKVYVAEDENRNREARKRMTKAFKKMDKSDPEQVEAFEKLLGEFNSENPESGCKTTTPMVQQVASTAGVQRGRKWDM